MTIATDMKKKPSKEEIEKQRAERKARRDLVLKKMHALMEQLGKEGKEPPLGYVSPVGYQYSMRNCAMLFVQEVPTGVVAGFQQWKKVGRSVKKGEHGALILFPITKKAKEDENRPTDTSISAKDLEVHFSTTTVFHFNQTESTVA